MVLPVSVQSRFLTSLAVFLFYFIDYFVSFSASVLGSVFYKVAILATLRSKKLNGSTIGVMITASHNPEEVNITRKITRGNRNLRVKQKGQRCQAC